MSIPHKSASDSNENLPSKLSPESRRKAPNSLVASHHLDDCRLHQSTGREGPDVASPIQQDENPSFEPFFTLIENPAISEHYHPTVHYIFADDEDADILTEAACRALSQDDAQHSASQGSQDTKLPAPIDGVREHYIIVDVQPTDAGTTFEVTDAHSLSSDWQVTDASISRAPTIQDLNAVPGDGLMLKIEAAGALIQTEPEALAGTKKSSISGRVETFDKGMLEIRKTVGSKSSSLQKA
jgi:hypothetical protein